MKSLSSIAAAVTAGPRVEIYTELVCRGYTPTHVKTPTFLTLPTTTPSVILGNAVSLIQAHVPPHEQAYLSDLHIIVAHASIPPGSCASDPLIQTRIAQLGAGMCSVTSIYLFTNCAICSDCHHWRHLVVPHDRLVGWGAC